jgi:hypothetical protein
MKCIVNRVRKISQSKNGNSGTITECLILEGEFRKKAGAIWTPVEEKVDYKVNQLVECAEPSEDPTTGRILLTPVFASKPTAEAEKKFEESRVLED